MKTLFPVLAVLWLAGCAADEVHTSSAYSPPTRTNNSASIQHQCEQHFAKVADVMERGKKVKACVRSRMAH